MTKTLDLGGGGNPRNPFNAEEVFGLDLVLETIPHGDEKFDYLTAFDLRGQLGKMGDASSGRSSLRELMEEVHRVLKPCGIFLMRLPRGSEKSNVITDENISFHFDGAERGVSVYEFKGKFKVRLKEGRGEHSYVALKKTSLPKAGVRPVSPNEKISVIVPVHNGAKYVAATLESLLAQSYANFEVLCIDDCSTDESHSILKALSLRDERIRVFKTDENFGSAPKVLNFALANFVGTYFVYSSQDDLFSKDWLANMVAKAVETGADAVIPDVIFYHESGAADRSLIGIDGDRSIELSGPEAVLKSLDWTIPANALWRADLVKKIGFEEFSINSDEFSARLFFNACHKVVFSEGTFFYRQDNAEAVTKKKTSKAFDFPYTHVRLAHWLHEQGYPPAVIRKEMKKAFAIMASLRSWLRENKSIYSASDMAAAEAAIRRYQAMVAAQPAFGVLAMPSRMDRIKALWKGAFPRR